MCNFRKLIYINWQKVYGIYFLLMLRLIITSSSEIRRIFSKGKPKINKKVIERIRNVLRITYNFVTTNEVIRIVRLFAVFVKTVIYAFPSQDPPGQNIYHLRNDGVYEGSRRILARDFSRRRVTMTFNGIDLFVAEGDYGTRTSTIFWVSTDGGSEPVVFETVQSSYDISIDSCCQYVAYGYPDRMSGSYKIQLRSIQRDGFSKTFEIRDPNLYIATVVIDCEAMPEEGADPSSTNHEIIRLVTEDKIYRFDLKSTVPTYLPEITHMEPLIAPPRCAAFWNDGVDEYLFTAYEDRDQIQVTAMGDGFENLDIVFRLNHALKTACLTTSDNNLYSFSRHTSEFEGYLITIPAQTVIDHGTGNFEVPQSGVVLQITNLTNVGDFVNGISVCLLCEDKPCLNTPCTACNDPGYEDCGFCSGDNDYCFCSDPSDPGCSYDSQTLEESCRRPIPKLDAYCVVLNPLAQRRKRGPIKIAVVVGPHDEWNYDSATLIRGVKTGRWPAMDLPVREPIPLNDLMKYGFSAEALNKARGRRFGFFEAEVQRRDYHVDEIYCISTEKSAFTNKVFTYSVAKGESAQITASMKNIAFLNQVKWKRTAMATGKTEDLRNDASLSLTIINANKEKHEGVYEVYRERRWRRTWHPIMYLYVRSCAKDKFGSLCDFDCPDCGNGVCDLSTGECRCYPGFTGINCESACSSPDEIGQNCDIICSNIFPGDYGDNCINLEICGADDLGCSCRSGLQAPDCNRECEDGKWGPLCSKTCECGTQQTCDARMGCV